MIVSMISPSMAARDCVLFGCRFLGLGGMVAAAFLGEPGESARLTALHYRNDATHGFYDTTRRGLHP